MTSPGHSRRQTSIGIPRRSPNARGIVVGLYGRAHNVVKVNPPLCVTGEDASAFLQATDEALAALGRSERGTCAGGLARPQGGRVS
jgi:hypothetical protein